MVMTITETSAFESVDDAKKAIMQLTILQKRPVETLDHIRCAGSSCSFEISCNKRKDGKVHVCKLVKDHE
jgi:hypothetical protein